LARLTASAARAGERLAGRVADLIWPPSSLLSDARVDRLGTMEPELWRALQFLHGPGCARCGVPLPEATVPDVLCGVCLVAPPPYERARAALSYDDLSKPLVLSLKHAGRKDGLRAFSAWMLEAAPHARDADLIAPVPLHWSRLWSRGFNQSAWLAGAVAARTGARHVPDALVRKRRTPSQNGLSRTGRARNVQGAFTAKAPVAGARVLLIDDVLTTGATVGACARALKRAGATSVDVLALARVVRPTPTECPP
jgi:ComF family protein